MATANNVSASDQGTTRTFGLVVVSLAAVCTLSMNAIFGWNSAVILIECVLYAVISMCFDAVKIFGLSQVFHHWERGAKLKSIVSAILWVGAVIFCLFSAFGFAVMSKETTTDARTSGNDKYQESLAKKERAKADLKLAYATQKWNATSGCTDATLDESKEFCRQVKFHKDEVTEAEAVMKELGEPKYTDPQSAAFSKMIGIDAKELRFRLAIFFAVMAEMITAFGFVMFSKSTRPYGSVVKKKKRKVSIASNVTPIRKTASRKP